MSLQAREPISDRRIQLRRAEDCVLLLEAAAKLGGKVVTPTIHGALRDRLPSITLGMPLADALTIACAAREAEPDGPLRQLERRVLHRRPAFDHQLLLGDLFPWRP
jgi:hypothetical protein